MAIYNSFSGSGDVTLISQSSSTGGSISKILLCNTGSSDLTITVRFEDNNANPNIFKIISSVVIPTGASLVLEDNLSFNTSLFSLKANYSGDFDVIIS